VRARGIERRHGAVAAAAVTQRRIVMRTIILASLVLAVTSATSFAATPLIDARQNAQQHRIFKGIQQGDLSFNEALKLQKGQQRVQNLKNKALASGGVITPLERARIHAAQNIQSGRIFLKRH
jgi:hypothetical protein